MIGHRGLFNPLQIMSKNRVGPCPHEAHSPFGGGWVGGGVAIQQGTSVTQVIHYQPQERITKKQGHGAVDARAVLVKVSAWLLQPTKFTTFWVSNFQTCSCAVRNISLSQLGGNIRVGHDWATSLSLFTFMHWRRQWQPTLVFLPGESQGQGSLVGSRPWGRTESDTTEVT